MKKKKQKEKVVTIKPQATDNLKLSIANLQGLGERDEQQDSFYISALGEYENNGLLALLCDGMGGLNFGREIADTVIQEIACNFKFDLETLADVVPMLCAVNSEIYKNYGGNGGSTLIMCYIFKNKLWFWCAGDSDLYLLRNDKLYTINSRHELKSELYSKVLNGEMDLSYALSCEQLGALTEYMGNSSLSLDYSKKPFGLVFGDKLMLCSDGVSDTLDFEVLQKHMQKSSYQCCEMIEKDILKANRLGQDNYTAIIINF